MTHLLSFSHHFLLLGAEKKERDGSLTLVNFEIEQKGMTFDQDFCYSFSFFSSSLFFLGGKRKGEENNKSLGQKSFLSARSILFKD